MSVSSRIALLSLFLPIAAFSQSTTGQFVGRVADPTDSPVPGVAIQVTNVDTGLTRRLETNEDGRYIVPLLTVGNYRVTFQKDGFRPINRTGITLAVDQTARIDAVLELGVVAEAVDVVATAPLVQQETSALGQVIDNSKVVNMPINGRSPFKLLQMTTNVVSMPSSYGQFKDIPLNTQDDTAFFINGGRAYTNELLVDGIPSTTGVSNQITTIPNVDSTQEFKVQSSNLSAEWGRFGGGVINVCTRSGTNQLHGSLPEFLRNSALDSNDFFNKRAGQDIPPFRLNQYGYAVGGPFFIPKLIGKDRTFFFTDYQGTRWRRGQVYLQTVPTALQRDGDFSQTLTQTGQLIAIYDPRTTRPDPARAGAFLRTPFPQNRIQRSDMDPVALIPFYPVSNTGGDPITKANNYVSNAGNGIDQLGTTTRIDHAFTNVWRTFGRFSINRTTLTFRDLYCPTNEYCNPASPANGRVIVNNYSGGLDNTVTLSPTTVLNVRYGFARYFWTRTGRGLGFDQRQVAVLPTSRSSSVEGFGPLGGGSLVQKAEDTHSLLGSIIRIAGNHNIKVGMDIRLRRPNYFTLTNGGGQYSFTRAMTRGPDPNVVTANAGIGVASLLLGAPSSGSVNFATGAAMQNLYYAGYIQDDLRLSTRLTLNLGLRYETESPYSERYNQFNYFDFSLPSPVRNTAFPNLKGRLVFADSKQRTLNDWDRNNFAPRAGFAYSLNKSMVIRGGGGVFFMPLSTTVFNPSVQNWCDLRSERSVSESDIPQAVSFSYVVELPIGPKRRSLSTARGIAGKLVEGWQVTGFATYYSGFPLVTSATIPNGGNRPNSTGRSAELEGGRSRNDQVNQWFDTSAFAQPAAFTFGNVGRTLPDVRSPAFGNWDASIMKDTRIREGWTLQFPAESFNGLNRPDFGLPNTALGNVQFGRITGTINLPRVNQLA